MSAAPLVGITTRRVSVTALGSPPAGLADHLLDAVITDYAQSVADAGGIPLMLSRAATPASVVERLDALVLTGGSDVEPERYGATPGPHATAFDDGRDEFEVDLIHAALAIGLPILAICRGMQILNVALGGTLVEHLPSVDGFSHMETDEYPSVLRHDVAVDPSSALGTVVDLDDAHRLWVNSFHHQAVENPGGDLRVVGTAGDGTIEALELPGHALIAVQWHPEMHAGCDPLFGWLIGAAHDYAKGST